MVDPGRAGGRLAIRGGGVVAAATYRKREVEDEDEEAVHGAADVDAGCGGGARRLAEVPSHTQNGPSPVTPAPAISSRGATPPIVPGRAEPVEEESARACVGGSECEREMRGWGWGWVTGWP